MPPSFLSACLACLCLGSFGALTLLDMANGPGSARQERSAPTPAIPRGVTDIPRFVADARFYVTERYALKERLVAWNGAAKIGLFGHSPAQNVGFGRDGFLFLVTDAPVAIAQGRNRLTPPEARQWHDHLARARDAFAARGIDYAFVMGPNKHGIYPDLLPGWLDPAPLQETRTTDIARAVSAGQSQPPFDSREPLLAARADAPDVLLYHPTDTHWTEWGAALVLHQVLERMDIETPAPTYTVADLPRSGDMARMIGRQDAWTARAPVLTDRFTCTDAEGMPVEITTIDPLIPPRLICGAPGGRPERLVVFHDSFGLPAIPFLAARFARVDFVTTDAADPDLAARLGADIALQIIVERKLVTDQPGNFLAASETGK